MKSIFLLVIAIGLLTLQWSSDIGRTIRKRFRSQRGSMSEGLYLNDIVKFEDENNFSREVVTVLSGQKLPIGQVLGKITAGSCPTTGTAVSGNTGNGTCTAVTAGWKVKVGTYILKCVDVVTNSGIFSVKDPDGISLPDAVIGTYVNDQINFTLNDGSPDFAVGDSFTITVPAGAGQVKAINPANVDGSGIAYGILIAACDATAGDTQAVAIVRTARVVQANLTWIGSSPDMSAAQIATAMAQLKKVFIIPVTEV